MNKFRFSEDLEENSPIEADMRYLDDFAAQDIRTIRTNKPIPRRKRKEFKSSQSTLMSTQKDNAESLTLAKQRDSAATQQLGR